MSNCRVMCFRAFSFVSYSVYRPIFCLMCMICVFYSCEKNVKENRTMFFIIFYWFSFTFLRLHFPLIPFLLTPLLLPPFSISSILLFIFFTLPFFSSLSSCSSPRPPPPSPSPSMGPHIICYPFPLSLSKEGRM